MAKFMRVVLTVLRDQKERPPCVSQVGVTTHVNASWDRKAVHIGARAE